MRHTWVLLLIQDSIRHVVILRARTVWEVQDLVCGTYAMWRVEKCVSVEVISA